MSAVDKVIALAKDECGYLEKRTGEVKYLYDKTANAGSNNYTKYNYELASTDIFNGSKFGYEWCTSFYCWLFYHLFGQDKTKSALYLPSHSLAAGCVYAVQYYKAKGKYQSTPQIGAQIFFEDSDGDPCHTGIVYGFDSSTVWTIEGNTSGASGVIANGGGVCKKSYSRSYSRIHGYGIPNWSVLEREYTEGWQKDSKGWWYRYKDGSYPASKWAMIDNKWYYFDDEGYMMANCWKFYNNNLYYLGSDGAMVVNKSLKIDEEGKLTYSGNYYHLLGEVTYKPYREALDAAISKGFIKGEGGTGDNLILNLSEESVRMIVYLHRAGLF